LEVGSTREKKGPEEGKCKKFRVADWPGNMEMQVACAHVSRTRKLLLQPKVNDSADVQRGRVNISGFFGAKALHH
jgi:hypothetical protein